MINKLLRAGKHAELWSQKVNPSPKPKNKDDKPSNKGPKHPKLISFNCEDDDIDDCRFGDEEGEDFQAAGFQFRAPNLDLLRQQAIEANNANKGIGIGRIPGPATGNGKMNKNNNININNNKPGNGNKTDPNQSMAIKNTPSGIDHKTFEALQMNNAQPFGNGRGSINLGEVQRTKNNDLNSLMNTAGFNGSNLMNFATPSSIGANSSNTSQGGLHLQQNNACGYGYQPSSTSGFPMATGQYHHQQQPSSINGYNNLYHQQQPLMNMNNMLNRQAMNQQPQMMYNRAQLVPPNTGYYYNYNASPVHPSYPYVETSYHHGHNSNSAADMFSDENTSSSCSIM